MYELSDAGMSSRRIADIVWGDPRFKNRVLRLLRRRDLLELELLTPDELERRRVDALEQLDVYLARARTAGS